VKRSRERSATKRSLSIDLDLDLGGKRTKMMSSELLQHLSAEPMLTTPRSHSVLMNLLVSGADVSHGYICIGPSRSRAS